MDDDEVLEVRAGIPHELQDIPFGILIRIRLLLRHFHSVDVFDRSTSCLADGVPNVGSPFRIQL
jgi:hypothetical protein